MGLSSSGAPPTRGGVDNSVDRSRCRPTLQASNCSGDLGGLRQPATTLEEDKAPPAWPYLGFVRLATWLAGPRRQATEDESPKCGFLASRVLSFPLQSVLINPLIGRCSCEDAPMRRFTLDTSCIIAAVNGESAANDIEQLVELARSGQIEIVITSGFEVDQRKASSERQRANLEWLSRAPILAVPGPFRFDMSSLGGPDVLVDDESKDVDEAIAKIVLPKGLKPENAGKRMQDVHHLIAHHMAKRDIFVTSDDDDMIRKRSELKSKVGIAVATPSEAVVLAHNS
jgi:hypothetical protein